MSQFAFGSNDHWPSPPFGDRWKILYNFPERHTEIKGLLKESLTKKEEELNLLGGIARTAEYALHEARFQQQSCLELVDRLSDDFAQNLRLLEETLGAYLYEIKWVLAHIDDKLSAILKILQAPLGTKARELTIDGNRALSRGFFNEAKDCFSKALEHKPSDYWALTSLGFTLIDEGNISGAIDMFSKAAAYVPSEATSEAHAFENLARAYFIKGDFNRAYDIGKRALTIREKGRCLTKTSQYIFAVYSFLSGNTKDGKPILSDLCVAESRYFLTFATDSDLAPVKDEILEILNEMAKKEYERTCLEKDRVAKLIETVVKPLHQKHTNELNEYDSILNGFRETCVLLDLRDYTHSYIASKLLSSIKRICDNATQLVSLRLELPKSRERLNNAKRKWEEAEEWYRAAKKEFKSGQVEGIRSTEEFTKFAKVLVFLALAVLGIYGIVDILDSESGLNFILALIIGIPIFAILYFLFSLFIGWVVSSVLNGIKSYASKRIESRTFNTPFPQSEWDNFIHLQSDHENIEYTLTSTRSKVAPLLSYIDKTLEAYRS